MRIRRTRWAAAALAAGATALAAVVGPAAVASASPTVPSPAEPATGTVQLPAGFYDAPSLTSLVNVPTGTILNSRPVTLPTGEYTTAVNAWVIVYRTTAATGTPAVASATVLVPVRPWGGPGERPLVDYAPGTQGWGQQCAASIEMLSSSTGFDETGYVDQLLADNWAVVVNDYQGLGTTDGPEPYIVGQSEGYDVLDAAVAAEQLAADGLNGTDPVAIIGYSQGGGAAGWAAQLESTRGRGYDASRLHLDGVALGGTPANIQDVVTNADGSPWMLLIMGILIGFNATYPNLNLASYLNPAGVAMEQAVGGECNPFNTLLGSSAAATTAALTAITPYALQPIELYLSPFTPDPLTNLFNTTWQTDVDANDLGGTTPSVPVFEWHGLVDEMVPVANEIGLWSDWCAGGATDQLNFYLGDHPLAASEGFPDAVTWLADRFGGQPAPSTCL